MPDFSLERRIRRTSTTDAWVIGLDEAGRGPWAGPVVAAAAWLDMRRTPRVLRRYLDDSKVLAPDLRVSLYEEIMACAGDGRAAVAFDVAPVAEVDAVNILRASLLAMRRAAEKLSRATGAVFEAALVDGPHAPRLGCACHPVVRGDSLSLSIAAASVVAKVTRDRMMRDLACAFPGYGWERNKGYGTPEHRKALHALGPCSHHRRSFAPIRALMLSAGPVTRS